MNSAPKIIGGLETDFYSPIDERHCNSGHATHVRNGTVTHPTVKGLAICKLGSNSFYLFGCDENWNVLTDSIHESLNDAEDVAETECEGVIATWMRPG